MKKFGILIIMIMMGIAGCTQKQKPISGVEKENFDLTVRAQDNFYLHVNGNWLKRTKIPSDRSNYGSFTELQEKIEKRLEKIIDQLLKQSLEEGSDEQKIADLYRSFMDTVTIEKKGAMPLEKEIKMILDAKNKRELARLLAYLRKKNVQIPFSSFVNIDDKDVTRYITFIRQSGLGLPDRDYYFANTPKFQKIREEYVKYISRILELAGISSPEKKAKRIFNLERNLAKHHWTRVENRDANKRYNKMTSAEIKKIAHSFDWDSYFIAAGLANEKEMVVNQPSYLEGFAKVWSRNSLDTWKTYLVYKVINRFAPFLSSEFVETNFLFYGKTLRGIQELRPRKKRALQLVNGTIGMLLGKIYVNEYFPPEAKARMKQLVANLKKAYAERIKNLDWMSEKTKQAALEKLNKFYPKIGYPDKWKDYTGLVIKKDDLIGNLIRIANFEYEYNINKLGKPIDRTEWFMVPQMVNAYYNPKLNEIVFPAGILEPPFFNMRADDAINYGAIGAVIRVRNTMQTAI